MRCAAELKEILGPSNYACLIALLAGVKTSHVWIEAHPEVNCEDHPVVREHFLSLVRSEPQLAEIFRNHKEAAVRKISRSGAKGSILDSEDLYREFFENASDIIFTYDFSGKILSVNRAVERITGYTVAEALELKIARCYRAGVCAARPENARSPDRRRSPSQLRNGNFRER